MSIHWTECNDPYPLSTPADKVRVHTTLSFFDEELSGVIGKLQKIADDERVTRKLVTCEAEDADYAHLVIDGFRDKTQDEIEAEREAREDEELAEIEQMQELIDKYPVSAANHLTYGRVAESG